MLISWTPGSERVMLAIEIRFRKQSDLYVNSRVVTVALLVIGLYLRILSSRNNSDDPYPHLSSHDKERSHFVAHRKDASPLLHPQPSALRNAIHLAHGRGRLTGVSVSVAAQ